MLAKIEKPQAVERLADIIEHADALMVARGDLGVEMPLERVPGIQKQITRAARRAGKPVVVATQMLESMITAPVPTRAEVSDVATAVFEGADAIMLSAESASGAYPVEAVATMDRIATEVERDPNYKNIMHAQRTEPEATGADAISAAARQIAETLNLAAICCYTSSGATGMRAARERPQTPIIALSPIVATARRLSLVWGLHCHRRRRARRRSRAWSTTPAPSPARRASPSPASASSSPPACRSALPARPTCCASPSSPSRARPDAGAAPASRQISSPAAFFWSSSSAFLTLSRYGSMRSARWKAVDRALVVTEVAQDHAETAEARRSGAARAPACARCPEIDLE